MQALTFDFWNTLFKESDPAKTASLRIEGLEEVIKRYGHNVEKDLIRKKLVLCWDIARREQLISGIDITPRKHVENLICLLELPLNEKMMEEMYYVYTNVLWEVPPLLMNDRFEVLESLAQKYPLGLICNTGATPGVVLREFMTSQGIHQFFSTVVFSDEVGWAKPNPEIFHYTLRLLGADPPASLHTGDDPLTDVIGARKAGMKSVWLAPEAVWAVPECTWHIKEFKELTSIL
ncbi:MAG: HAD family hydrolase [Chitinophagales bacterium]